MALHVLDLVSFSQRASQVWAIQCRKQGGTTLRVSHYVPSRPESPVRRPIETLTSEEMKALLRACSGRAPTGIRNRAMIVLGWRGGLQLGEVLGLHPNRATGT